MFRPDFARIAVVGLALCFAATTTADAQRRTRPRTPAPKPRAVAPPALSAPISAPITDVRYDVTYDEMTAASRTIKVRMTLTTPGRDPVLLSLPAWTPGSYEISNFARYLSSFRATAGNRALDWDKLDHDTWRITPEGATRITLEYDVLANEMDNAKSWTKPDFAFFNGTTLFMYPEGRDLGFPSTVYVVTNPRWHIATQLDSPREGMYTARNFHDLVDAPFFVGRFDFDSVQIAGKWTRLATYPVGAFTSGTRAALWKHQQQMIPPQIAVFGETPWTTYTTLIVIDSVAGGSALEHANSHLGIYPPELVGTVLLPSITAHEIFHAWNVKRLRPIEMSPYDYSRPQPTTLLWMSEGVTDYYADVALVRGGIVDSAGFLSLTSGKIAQVNTTAPVALEDASLSSWVLPTDGTGYVYYPKGSLAGFMIDILIRDASDNRSSLDAVMRELYGSTYKKGKGFSEADWWSAVQRAAKGKSFTQFTQRYVDGRDDFPWDSILPLAGMRFHGDTVREPRIGINAAMDSGGMRIGGVAEGGMAEMAGVQIGDILLSVGDVTVQDATYGAAYRARYANEREGTPLVIRVRRGGQILSLNAGLRFWQRVSGVIVADPAAPAKAVRIRNGILRGR